MTTTECPECAAAVALKDDAEKGEIITCPECSVELEILEIAPVKLGLAPPEEEDWGE